MREGWHRHANCLLIDAGPHGSMNCGHAHADALAFELTAFGRTLLVDPGTYTYSGSAEAREWFRSSAAHNTLVVDGQSSSEPGGTFAWRQIARTRVRGWISTERYDYFEGSHDGYLRLTSPVTHARRVLFLKGDYWIISDRISAAGRHSHELRFHFTPDAVPRVEMEPVAALRERPEDDAGLEIFAFGGGGSWRREQGWVSRCYGERTAALVWSFAASAEGDHEFVTFLIPRVARAPRALVREIEATGGLAFEVRDSHTHDLLLLRQCATVSTPGITSDADWCWLRFGPDPTTPTEWLLIGGSHLWLDDVLQRDLNQCAGLPA